MTMNMKRVALLAVASTTVVAIAWLVYGEVSRRVRMKRDVKVIDDARRENLIDEASWNSFPASDPPSSWAGRDIAPHERSK